MSEAKEGPSQRLRTITEVVQAVASQHKSTKPKKLPGIKLQVSKEKEVAIGNTVKTRLLKKRLSIANKALKEVKGPKNDVNLTDEETIYTCPTGIVRPKKVTYGIGKRGMQRTIYRFQKVPEAHPLDVSFEFPNSTLTHQQVLQNANQQLSKTKEAAIETLTYFDRNVIFGAQMMENRWVLRVNSLRAKYDLLQLGLVIYNRKVKVRAFSEALEQDYAEFRIYCPG